MGADRTSYKALDLDHDGKTAEHQLLIAVLQMAVNDYLILLGVLPLTKSLKDFITKKKSRSHQKDLILDWLVSPEKAPMSCAWICEQLDINHAAFINQLDNFVLKGNAEKWKKRSVCATKRLKGKNSVAQSFH